MSYRGDVREVQDLPVRELFLDASKTESGTRPPSYTRQSVYASTTRSSGDQHDAPRPNGMASTCSSVNPAERIALQCCEKTNWLPARPSGPTLTELRSFGSRTSVEPRYTAKTGNRVIGGRHEHEHRPPVARGPLAVPGSRPDPSGPNRNSYITSTEGVASDRGTLAVVDVAFYVSRASRKGCGVSPRPR